MPVCPWARNRRSAPGAGHRRRAAAWPRSSVATVSSSASSSWPESASARQEQSVTDRHDRGVPSLAGGDAARQLAHARGGRSVVVLIEDAPVPQKVVRDEDAAGPQLLLDDVERVRVPLLVDVEPWRLRGAAVGGGWRRIGTARAEPATSSTPSRESILGPLLEPALGAVAPLSHKRASCPRASCPMCQAANHVRSLGQPGSNGVPKPAALSDTAPRQPYQLVDQTCKERLVRCSRHNDHRRGGVSRAPFIRFRRREK